MSEHRYTDDEVRAIFERAAVRQEEARRAEDAGRGGLSLAELQRIGAESGIDPAHVAVAAAELARGAPEAAERDTLLGMPVAFRATRRLAAPVSDETWERMVTELRRQFDAVGIAGELGRQREWTTAPSGRRLAASVRVSVEPEGAGSRVTVEQTLRKSALPFVIVSGVYSAVALVFGILLAAGALGSDGAPVPVLFAAMALLMFGGAQIGFRLYARRQQRRFDQALDRIERLARDAASPVETETTPVPAAPAEPEARLDLDALDAPLAEDDHQRARSRRRAR